MKIQDARLELQARFQSWAQKMAAIDVENDFALLQCLSHGSRNYGILKNALRKDKAEALRLWLVRIRNTHRFINGVEPPKGMIFGPQGELLPNTPENRILARGLDAFWIEEHNYDLLKGAKASSREWSEHLASWDDGREFDYLQVLASYGHAMGEEMQWKAFSTLEYTDYSYQPYHSIRYKFIYATTFGDWCIFPRIDFYTSWEGEQRKPQFCNVQVYFQLTRRDEILKDMLLFDALEKQPKDGWHPHVLMGLFEGGWQFRSLAHAEAVLPSYTQLMHICDVGIKLNLEGLNAAD